MRRRADGPRTVAVVTASDLLARPGPVGPDPSADVDDPLPAALLADLHAPDLIITDDYVGPERRTDTGPPPNGAPPGRLPRRPRTARPPGSGGGPTLRPRHLVAAAAVTALIVAPLTLQVARPSTPPPPPPHRPTTAASSTTPAGTGRVASTGPEAGSPRRR